MFYSFCFLAVFNTSGKTLTLKSLPGFASPLLLMMINNENSQPCTIFLGQVI